MHTICDFLDHDHKYCDDLFVKVETSVAQRDWDQADIVFREFHAALLAHLDGEETVVFPAFKQVFADASMPIAILCREHLRIRGLAVRLSDALSRRDPSDFLLHAETLTLQMQEHSVKEDTMLYPLLDRVLSGCNQHIVNALRTTIGSHGTTP